MAAIDFLQTKAELIIALLAFGISIYSLLSQRKHNRLTFKPLAYILPVNYENKISVRILNQGTGPMIVTSFTARKEDKFVNNIIGLMPGLPRGMSYSTFLRKITERAIIPNEELNLFEFRANDRRRSAQVWKIRQALHDIEINVTYENIYGDKETISKTLKFVK